VERDVNRRKIVSWPGYAGHN